MASRVPVGTGSCGVLPPCGPAHDQRAAAVRHGRVPDRDFHVRLTAEADRGRLRLEVTDRRSGPGKTVWASVSVIRPSAK
ncbi:hypothetical protein [Streptomyces sp. NWU339]|uniref:hypothetical protein n=1 Tax=Streptomyces sp. NWU339 TaxID=2185284 RepID=UPI0015E8003C|nr:hypothetical protein [Streptomyces sp. NWU339]